MNEHYLKRFPQPARVGDLIDLPVLDLDSSSLGYVRLVVRTPVQSRPPRTFPSKLGEPISEK